MTLSESTKRDIFDQLEASNFRWEGKLSEVAFIKRVCPIDTLPSQDPRYQNMESDLVQHRINNNDWPYWWIRDDNRLGFFQNDENFKKLLREMFHPIVREYDFGVDEMIAWINALLGNDGYQFTASGYLAGKPIYSVVENNSDSIKVDNVQKFGENYIHEQLQKCESKLAATDYDGALTNARSLCESVIADIYRKITNNELEGAGDLTVDYKAITKLLNLDPSGQPNRHSKQILSSLISLIQAIDTMSNKMGDRHRRPIKPEKHHAKLVVNSSKIFIDFLYDTVAFQFGSRESIYERIVSALDSNLRLQEREELMADIVIKNLYEMMDDYIKNLVKTKFIQEFSIDSFRRSDIFFAAMLIFLDHLKKSDIETIKQKHQGNRQACGLSKFLSYIDEKRPEITSS